MSETAAERRRRHSRFPVALDVSLDGLAGTTTNISLGGAQVACATRSPEMLASYLESETLRAVLAMPGGGTVAVAARVIYTLCREGECLVGLEFGRFEADGLAALRSFIARRRGPGRGGPGARRAATAARRSGREIVPNSDQVDNL